MQYEEKRTWVLNDYGAALWMSIFTRLQNLEISNQHLVQLVEVQQQKLLVAAKQLESKQQTTL